MVGVDPSIELNKNLQILFNSKINSKIKKITPSYKSVSSASAKLLPFKKVLNEPLWELGPYLALYLNQDHKWNQLLQKFKNNEEELMQILSPVPEDEEVLVIHKLPLKYFKRYFDEYYHLDIFGNQAAKDIIKIHFTHTNERGDMIIKGQKPSADRITYGYLYKKDTANNMVLLYKGMH